MEDICSKFNVQLQGKILIAGDEIANYASHKFADILKALITEVNKSIEPKGRDSYMINSFERYIFTSNNEFSFRVEQGGRRLLPLKVNPKKKGDFKYFDKLTKLIDDVACQELFFNYMSSRDISYWNFREIPHTQMKSDLVMEGLSNAIHFIIDYVNGGIVNKSISLDALFTLYKSDCETNNIRAISCRKFMKDIATIGVDKTRVMKNGTRSFYCDISRSIIQKKLIEMTDDKNYKFDPISENTESESIYDSDEN
jgi:phage/plasmid-associated DNA primase